jgi:phage gp45-like
MIGQIRELSARLRNVFAAGEFRMRYKEGERKGRIQVETHNGKVLEKKEAFPYGFCAKAKSGRAFVFCQGGNPDGFEIFPVQPGEGVEPPELEEGDTAVYTGEGAYAVFREAGDVQVYAGGKGKVTINTEGGDIEINVPESGEVKIICGAGKLYFGNGSMNICELLLGLIDEIKAVTTFGSPVSQAVSPVTQQKLEAYKNQVKALFMEEA